MVHWCVSHRNGHYISDLEHFFHWLGFRNSIEKGQPLGFLFFFLQICKLNIYVKNLYKDFPASVLSIIIQTWDFSLCFLTMYLVSDLICIQAIVWRDHLVILSLELTVKTCSDVGLEINCIVCNFVNLYIFLWWLSEFGILEKLIYKFIWNLPHLDINSGRQIYGYDWK